MAMFEQTPFEDGVRGSRGAAGGGGARNDFRGSAPYTMKTDHSGSEAVCDRCGTLPGAISRTHTASSTASGASSASASFGGSRLDSALHGGMLSAEPAWNSPGHGTHPAEPVKGLAAFGSQGSLRGSNSTATTAASRTDSHMSTDPSQRPCTCQGKQSTNGVRHRGASGLTSRMAPGISSAGLPGGNAGYRVLQWSDLSHLTYMTSGAMCELYSAELDGMKVAVKVPRKDCEAPAVAEHDLEVELDVLKGVKHKHIISLIGAGMRDEKPHRFLVLEFLELGTLADKLDSNSKTEGGKESTFVRRQKRTKRYRDFFMVTMLERSLELSMALEHLHHHMPETFVVHRDLKPDNVGFKADGTLKLFDFGLARVVKRRNRVNARYEMTGETGSMRYMAPEVVESLPYNEKVDVYAFGLLLWEMLEDNRVFDGMGVSDFYQRVVNAGARPNLDPSWPQDLRKLITQCWHADVDRRPNFRVITERLRELYNNERHSGMLCMSALNLNEDEHPKLRGGSAVSLARSATTTNVVSPRRTGGGPSSQTEIGQKKGMLRRSFGKIGRMLNPNKGGAKATLTHTAPEAYSSSIAGRNDYGRKGKAEEPLSEEESEDDLVEETIYGVKRRDSSKDIKTRRTHSEGMIMRHDNRRK